MSKTFSGAYQSTVTLTASAENPATVASDGRLYGGLEGSGSTGWEITNLGSVQGPSFGIYLTEGGSIVNDGLASSSGAGVLVAGRGGTIVNTGRILSGSAGVYLRAGGSVTDVAGGIIGGYQGVYDRGAALLVVNGGTIDGSATAVVGTGVVLLAGGTVTNLQGGVIGGYDGIYGKYRADSLVNTGGIQAFGTAGIGVYLQAGGGVTNAVGGVIAGYDGIVSNDGAMTVINQGSILGSGFAVRLAAGYANRVVIDPSALFTGTVDGGNAIGAAAASTLELGSASVVGTLSGIGTQFAGFAQILVDSGAAWGLTGANSLAAGVTLTNAGTLAVLDSTLSGAGLVLNNGVVRIDPSDATLAGLTGLGSVVIGGGGTLDVLGTVGVGQTIVFDARGGALEVGPTAFAGQIAGFGGGDTIVLAGVTDGVSAGIVNGNTLEVERTGHPGVALMLAPGVDYSGDSFAVGSAGAVTVEAEAPCFLRGTLIRTERGEVPVQDLAVGDWVLTLSGQSRPIRWIGFGCVAVIPGRRGAATPVIVRRGALADAEPFADLRITKGHSLFVDGVLIPAEFLVNHRSILWDDHVREAEFYHIELASHDVLVANGAAAESYRDDGNRWLFRNANDGWGTGSAPPCAPVLTGGAIVDAVWHRLLDRAGGPLRLLVTDDADVHLVADGVRLDAVTRSGEVLVFAVSGRRDEVRLVSRSGVPQELGFARDPRRLGVAVRRIVVRRMSRFRVVEAADRCLDGGGFHGFEVGTGMRWTDGDALVPASVFAGFEGAVEVVVLVGGSMRYPVAGALSEQAA